MKIFHIWNTYKNLFLCNNWKEEDHRFLTWRCFGRDIHIYSRKSTFSVCQLWALWWFKMMCFLLIVSTDMRFDKRLLCFISGLFNKPTGLKYKEKHSIPGHSAFMSFSRSFCSEILCYYELVNTKTLKIWLFCKKAYHSWRWIGYQYNIIYDSLTFTLDVLGELYHKL